MIIGGLAVRNVADNGHDYSSRSCFAAQRAYGSRASYCSTGPTDLPSDTVGAGPFDAASSGCAIASDFHAATSTLLAPCEWHQIIESPHSKTYLFMPAKGSDGSVARHLPALVTICVKMLQLFTRVISSFYWNAIIHSVLLLDSWSLCRRRLSTLGSIERGRREAVGNRG